MTEAAKSVDCPKCKGLAALLIPLKKVDQLLAVYGCSACGFTFHSDGRAFMRDSGELRDIFRGATLANKTLLDALGGSGMNAATRAVLTAQLIEYGMTMYFDGLKQGLLLGTIKVEREHGAGAQG